MSESACPQIAAATGAFSRFGFAPKAVHGWLLTATVTSLKISRRSRPPAGEASVGVVRHSREEQLSVQFELGVHD